MAESGVSAARRAFDIAHVKERILNSVSKGDLLSCIRVNKRWFDDSVRDVYKAVDYERVLTIIEGESIRKDLYLSYITEIDARMLRVSSMEKHFKALEEKKEEVPDARDTEEASRYLNNYHLETYNLIVPPLLTSCPKLLRILFGGPYDHFGRQSWVVEFGPNRFSPEKSLIKLSSHLKVSPRSPPKDRRPLASPPNTEIIRRFDFSVMPEDKAPSEESALEWKKALKEGSFFGKIYKAIKLGSIPLTIDDLIHLYQRQIDAGYAARLQHISALNVSPYDISELGSLARISGGGLRVLILAKECPLYEDEDGTSYEDGIKLSFDDLPSLISLVRNDLPNLEILHLNMKGIESAEEKCKDLLHPDILEIGGTLKDLVINTASDETFVYNILRVCCQLVRADGEIAINYDGREFWGGDDQTEFIRCIKKQSRERRKVLSTLDFEAMGIEDVDTVLDFDYDENHQPSIGKEGQHYFAAHEDNEEGRKAAMVDYVTRMQKSFGFGF